MKREYLGDSCDTVKRFWQQVFSDWAPLYAEARFLPQDLRDEFTRFTGIPVLTAQRTRNYSILNDPDTGIRLPDRRNQTDGQTHISIKTIIRQLQVEHPRCVVTYDQSYHRNIGLSHGEQRCVKMGSLQKSGVPSFYYVSHAPFLFAFPNIDDLKILRRRLIDAGMPRTRLEPDQQ